MGADKVRHVRASGAEVLVAADNSCLVHIGGLLGRDRSGVRTMHIAEVLAATERSAATTPAPRPAESAEHRELPT
jgi:L-lactate dehydrogenase complex protein LldE